MDFSSIKKVIIELTKRNYRSLLAMSFIIFVMTTFALTSDLLLSGSFILLFFIIVLPFFISMIIVNIKFKANVEFTPKQFYENYKVSLILGTGGVFRVLRSFIISFLVFIATSITLYICNNVIGFVDDTEFMNIYYEFVSSPNNSEILKNLTTFLSNSQNSFVIFLHTIFLISLAFAIFTFIYQIIRNTLIFFVQSNFGCEKNDAIAIYKKVFPKIKRIYNKVMFGCLWPFFILFPLGFILGSTLISLVNETLPFLMYGATVGGCLVLVPFLPMIVTTQDVVFSVFAPYFLVEAKDTLLQALQSINVDTNIPEEQKDLLRNFYVEQIKQIDLIKEPLEKSSFENMLNGKDDSEEK